MHGRATKHMPGCKTKLGHSLAALEIGSEVGLTTLVDALDTL